MTNPKKIAITGATGFIGQHLLEDLEQSMHHIVIITRNPQKTIRHLPKNHSIAIADLNNYESLEKALTGVDVLVNIAAEVRDYSKIAQTNIEGTHNLIQAIKKNKVQQVIHISSVGVIGMQYSTKLHTVTEEHICAPKNEYERTKLESERLFLSASQQGEFLLTILRPTNVFGPYHPYNALLNLMQHCKNNFPVIATRNAMVNYAFVKDLTAVIIHRFGATTTEILHVGNSCTLTDFIKTVSTALHTKKNILIIPQLLINLVSRLGINKLKTVSNGVSYSDQKLTNQFQYPFGIKKGIELTINYYKKEKLL